MYVYRYRLSIQGALYILSYFILHKNEKKKIIQYTHRSKNRLELFLSEIWIFPVYDNMF